MKKLYWILIVLIISSASIIAQQRGISIGGNVHFPVGEWSDAADLRDLEVLQLTNIQ